MLRKVIFWSVIAFVIFYVITSPRDAAVGTRVLGGLLITAAQSFGEFFNALIP